MEKETNRMTLEDYHKLPDSAKENILSKTVVIMDGIVHIFEDVPQYDPDALDIKDLF